MKEKWTIILAWLLMLMCHAIQAQVKPNKDNIHLNYSVRDDGRVEVSEVSNLSDYRVTVKFKDGGMDVPSVSVPANGSKSVSVTCTEAVVDADGQVPSFRILKLDPVKTPKTTSPKEQSKSEASSLGSSVSEKKSTTEDNSTVKKSINPITSEERKRDDILPSAPVGSGIPIRDVLPNFRDYVETIAYLSDNAIQEEKTVIDEHVTNLQNWKNIDSYISKENLNEYLESRKDTLLYFNDYIDELVFNYIDENYAGKTLESREDCIQQMKEIVTAKLKEHEENINELSKAMGVEAIHLDDEGPSWWLWLLVGLALLTVGFLVWWKMRKGAVTPARPRPVTPPIPTQNKRLIPTIDAPRPHPTGGTPSGIKIGATTQSVLFEQKIDDVVGNDQYMVIETSEFCDNSFVRHIYIKNTCVKDIYNMYAEDLRNPDNPMEDGCMVVGRWVFDEKENIYDVTLEQVVFPGDDAVFSEYEFSFGAKIKIKMRERLKRLRRESRLQYDNTCWVHSHPGLGVFFSNPDNNVHLSLKHPHHPMFLTALVIDILTPEQTLGIFTFKRDGNITSKTDLKRLYSLEEWYQWAVKSDRWAFKAEDYFDLLASAKEHDDNCLGVHLSNGAIIDMDMLVTDGSEKVAWMKGTTTKLKGRTRHLVSAVKKIDDYDGPKPDGVFVITEQRDLAAVEKAVGEDLSSLKYVLAYSTADGCVTAIPVMEGKLCIKEEYHGKQQLQDLKIWTRRKR